MARPGRAQGWRPRSCHRRQETFHTGRRNKRPNGAPLATSAGPASSTVAFVMLGNAIDALDGLSHIFCGLPPRR